MLFRSEFSLPMTCEINALIPALQAGRCRRPVRLVSTVRRSRTHAISGWGYRGEGSDIFKHFRSKLIINAPTIDTVSTWGPCGQAPSCIKNPSAAKLADSLPDRSAAAVGSVANKTKHISALAQSFCKQNGRILVIGSENPSDR